MNNLYVYIYPNNNICSPLTTHQKEMALISNLNLEKPIFVDLNFNYSNPYLRDLMSRHNPGRSKGAKNKKQLKFA